MRAPGVFATHQQPHHLAAQHQHGCPVSATEPAPLPRMPAAKTLVACKSSLPFVTFFFSNPPPEPCLLTASRRGTRRRTIPPPFVTTSSRLHPDGSDEVPDVDIRSSRYRYRHYMYRSQHHLAASPCAQAPPPLAKAQDGDWCHARTSGLVGAFDGNAAPADVNAADWVPEGEP
ncbi:hypothetical protein CDD83_7473 [Cordyceps sp. RAO-2017]|nr:hypothetical protein CDD83_7473 [Cordyceps sp. RAO-2017]